jgi:hypothetical protein
MAPNPSLSQALEAIYDGAGADSQESETLDFKRESSRSKTDTEKAHLRSGLREAGFD